MITTSNLMPVVLLQWEVEGSLKSTPAEKRHRLTLPLSEWEKWSTGNPCTAVSGVTENWMTVNNNTGKKQCNYNNAAMQELIKNNNIQLLKKTQHSSFNLQKILFNTPKGLKHETSTWMVNDCCDVQSGLGRLNAMRMFESSRPLFHSTSNFSFLPKRLGCLMESLAEQTQQHKHKYVNFGVKNNDLQK